MVGIYKFVNLINNECYVGKSINLEYRIKNHWDNAFRESSSEYNSLLHQAIREYGTNNFKVEIIETCSRDVLEEREKYYIRTLNTLTPKGYNVAAGGQGGTPVNTLVRPEIVLKIIDQIKNTDKPYTQIAKEFGFSPSTIKVIAYGKQYRQDNEVYPLRNKEHIKRILYNNGQLFRTNNPAAILNEQDVREIIDLLLTTDITYTDIGEMYGVSRDRIGLINSGKAWTWIERPIPCRDTKTKNLKRVDQVIWMLQNTNNGIKEIAQICGFKDRHSVQRINQHLIYKDYLKDLPNPIRQ